MDSINQEISQNYPATLPPPKKPVRKLPTSVANAAKAREAKLQKKALADEALKRQLEMMYSDESSDEEVMYIPTKRKTVRATKPLPPMPQPISIPQQPNAKGYYSADKLELEQSKKEMAEMKKEMAEFRKYTRNMSDAIPTPPPTPPVQSSQKEHVVSQLTSRILNF